MALYCSPDYHTNFKSIGHSIQEKLNTDFQKGGHGWYLGFPMRMILAIFDLQVSLIFPMNFPVNWPFGSEEKVQNRFSTWQLRQPPWISDLNNSSYFLIYKSPQYLPSF